MTELDERAGSAAGPTDGSPAGRRQGPGRRKLAADQDATSLTEATRADIVAVATREFVRNGYEGASINAIARSTQTSKRMLYYHFDSKRGLYRAVLEAAYLRVGRMERQADFEGMAPMEALRRYATHAFDMHLRNEDFVRLVMAENLNDAAAIGESEAIHNRITGNLASLETIWRRGCAEGSMRSDIRVIDLYLAITAVSFSAISNRATLKVSLGVDLGTPAEIAFRRRLVGDIACAYAASPPAPQRRGAP